MKKKILFIISQLSIFLIANINVSFGQNVNFKNSIKIKQKENIWLIKNLTDSIHLTRDSFSICFEGKKYDEKKNQFYATQIAAVTEDSCLKYITVGRKIQDIPFFSEGTGLAGEDFGYNNLFIDNEAHHYIYYINEKDRRAKLLNKRGDILELEWSIPQAFYKGEDISFSKLPLSHFYLIILNDINLNAILDEGEFKIISVTLE